MSPTPQVSLDEQRAFRKIAWRLLPILIVAYLLNYIDRTNIGVAALTMNKALGLTAGDFGVGAGVLFIGYSLFEIPSNLIQYRVGARRWICRIMISWGFASAAMIFAVGPKSYYALRFALGMAEAGFFPGVAFYLSCWFPAGWRARILAWFLVAIPASAMIGSPLSGALLALDGLLGLAGWQWVFLAEGLPCVFVGIAILYLLVDTPEEATWLSAEQRVLVAARLAEEPRERPIKRYAAVFVDVRMWLLTAIFMCFLIGAYAVQIWLPLLLKEGDFSNFTVGLLVAVPNFFAVVVMIAWAAWVDRRGGRVWNLAATCLLSLIGFVLALSTGSFAVSMFGISLALIGTSAARAVFWALPARFLVGEAAAGGLATINSAGTLGGFFGPSLIGWMKDATGSFTTGLLAMAGFLLIATVLSAVLRLFIRND